MEQETANGDASNAETDVTQDAAAESNEDAAALKAKLAEVEQTNRQLFERAKKAEGFVKVGDKWVKAPKAEEAIATKEELKATTGELEAAQLDFFDLKGYTDPDEVAILQNIMKRTGMSHREVIKDDYALTKIKGIREAKEVKDATPSSTKRSGSGSTNTVEYWTAKIDSGAAKLSDIPDFETRAAVIEKKEKAGGNDRLPPWMR